MEARPQKGLPLTRPGAANRRRCCRAPRGRRFVSHAAIVLHHPRRKSFSKHRSCGHPPLSIMSITVDAARWRAPSAEPQPPKAQPPCVACSLSCLSHVQRERLPSSIWRGSYKDLDGGGAVRISPSLAGISQDFSLYSVTGESKDEYNATLQALCLVSVACRNAQRLYDRMSDVRVGMELILP